MPYHFGSVLSSFALLIVALSVSLGKCDTDYSNPRRIQATASTPSNWILAHNTRRKKYHLQFGKSYVPLLWSTSIAKSAQAYAEKLIAMKGCQLQHGYQGDVYGGENLAGNGGLHPQTPDQVLQRWTENELPTSNAIVFSKSGHFTQVIWRSTNYVGCGVASKYGCHIHVCRYIRPGNCNLNHNNWKEATLADSSMCFPQCPTEGCNGASKSLASINSNTALSVNITIYEMEETLVDPNNDTINMMNETAVEEYDSATVAESNETSTTSN